MQEISCHQLSFSRSVSGHKTTAILDRIDCRFSAGSICVIGGATGAGKSTLIHLIGGLLRPTEGEIRSDGAPVSRWVSAHKDRWRKDVGIVFQHGQLIHDISALENVMLPLIARHSRLSGIRSAGINALRDVAAEHLAGKLAGRLSGGERQKVAIARALCANPGLLLADEPTAHQDDHSAAHVLELLERHARAGNIVVVVAHDRRVLACDLADRHFQLNAGKMETIR